MEVVPVSESGVMICMYFKMLVYAFFCYIFDYKEKLASLLIIGSSEASYDNSILSVECNDF